MSRLDPLLSPRSIAFVGASARPDTPGHDMMRMIRRAGFGGIVHAVNPGYRDVEGYPCVPALADLPAAPDLAVLSVRNERLEETLGQAVAIGARAAVIFASAVLPGDPALHERLAALAGPMPVCGPNCMGFYNDLDRVWICGFPSARQPEPGAIALVAHSGSVFGALCHNDPRLRFAFAVSPGQELTATVADYVETALERPAVRVIGLFIEAARDPTGLRRALDRAATAGIPVVVLKVGRTPAAAEAALTHTGAIAGSDAAWDALFDQYGVIRVEDLDAFAATLQLLATGRRTGPGGLVTIHDSGGERELTIDLADRAGVAFAPITEATRAAIQARLDPGLVAANPLDAWGTGRDFVPSFTACFNDLLADPGAALGFFCADFRDDYYLHAGFAEAALAAAAATDKPVACVTTYTQMRHDKIALHLASHGVPVLDGTAHALAAAKGALAWRDAQARGPDRLPFLPAGDRAAWRARLATGAPLAEADALDLLAAWGIPVVPNYRAASEQDVLAVPFAYPLVLKTATPGIAHKSDVGGVRLNLADAAALRAAYRDVAGRLGPDVIVMPMMEPAPEIALGMLVDPQWGPLVVVSAGGVLIELLDDRAQALAPFGPATARRLIDRLRIAKLLAGHRGGVSADLDALALAISRFSILARDLADLVSEIDINPILAGPEITAVDALIITREA
jgi:acyl-CoA synthetase (NDP forming)